MRLEDKVAIITGASSGIGRSIAFKFAEEGAKVVVADIREDPREGGMKTHTKIKEDGGESIFVETDVSSFSSVNNLFDRTAKEFGKIDILVNNAGIYSQEPLHKLDEGKWDKTIGVDLKGVYLCSKYFIEYMLDEDIEGKIVNISSIAGFLGFGESPGYCAAKGGVTNFTRELALDYASKGINVNAICPGVIKTQMTDQFRKDPEMKKNLEASTPYKRLGEPEDIANAAVFLASDESDFVNGENLVVDGGWSIH
ncbi:MAG: SDR family NAD(P)-dependent oxidoreductase [Candidatus Aenigmatarchaeota archaeon]